MGGPAEQGVACAHAHVAQHGAVGQVTLPARYGQFLGHEAEDSVGGAEVAFGVFKVDGVHFVRHGGGTDFAGLHFLFEIAKGNIAPHVAVEIDEDGVDAAEGLEELGHVVVRLDLDGVGVEGEPKRLFDKAVAMRFPIHIGVGGEMGVIVAYGAVDFAQKLLFLQLGGLALQTGKHVGDFLA